MSDNLPVNEEKPFVQALIVQATQKLKAEFSEALATVSNDVLSQTIQEVLDTLIPSRLTLSTSRPDYEAVLFRLMQEVESNGAWNAAGISDTGQMVLRMIASDVAYSQMSIVRALQEAYPHLARNETSIYHGARSLGVRLIRREPAYVDVTLERLDTQQTLLLPKWTQFRIGDNLFFLRDAESFGVDEITRTVRLYQGEVKREDIVSTGVPYQNIEVGFENWAISDTDIRMWVDSVEWQRTTEPLFLAQPNDRVFHDKTLPNGNAELKLGNGIFGMSPGAGLDVTISWIETKGGDLQINDVGLTVEWIDAPSGIVVSGLTTTPILGGRNPPDLSYYRVFAGDLRAANRAAHRRADHRAFALAYPGVVDARFRGQAEIAPERPSYANIVEVTLLTEPPFTEDQWNRFATYFESHLPFKPRLVRRDPIPRFLDIEADVFCHTGANLEAVRSHLVAHITEQFKPKEGTLGYSRYTFDIDQMLKGTGPMARMISYAKRKRPVDDIELENALSWVRLGAIHLTMYYSSRENYMGRID